MAYNRTICGLALTHPQPAREGAEIEEKGQEVVCKHAFKFVNDLFGVPVKQFAHFTNNEGIVTSLPYLHKKLKIQKLSTVQMHENGSEINK